MSVPEASLGLPTGFADLEAFAASWGMIETASARYLARQKASMAELQHFYDAMVPRIEPVLDYLDRFPMETPLPAAEQRLYNIALALTEVALAVELFRQPTVPHAVIPHFVTAEFGPG